MFSGIQLPKLLADGSLDFSGGAAGALDLWENNNLDRLFKCELCDKAFTQGKGFYEDFFNNRKIKIFMTALSQTYGTSSIGTFQGQ